jgi:hypothetical protein
MSTLSIGIDPTSDRRSAPVGTDDDSCLHLLGGPVSLDGEADYASGGVTDEPARRRAIPDTGSCSARSLEQDGIQSEASDRQAGPEETRVLEFLDRRVRVVAVEHVLAVEWRRSGRERPLEDAQPVEHRPQTRPSEEVGRGRIAREPCCVDEQDAVAAVAEEGRTHRARDAGTDDGDVPHLAVPRYATA